LASTSALATAAVVLATQAAHAISADEFFKRGIDNHELGDLQEAIANWNKAIEINPQYAYAYSNCGIAKRNLGDDRGGCADFKKAVSLGDQGTAQWLNSEGGAWCRNMR